MSIHRDTQAITAGRPAPEAGAPLNVAITPASTYRADGDLIYGRDGNPGWEALEDALGLLEGGNAVAFASGLAASSAVLDELPLGAVVIAQTALYYGVLEQLRERHDQGRISLQLVDLVTPESLERVGGEASLVWTESPTNPLMEIVDLARVATVAHQMGARLCVDNTFATPILQTPLALGADVVTHSVTKFIGGHADLLLGIAVSRSEDDAVKLRSRRSTAGATPGALEAFLALRGLRTLPVRMERAQATAMLLAQHLHDHPVVSRVRYPGLPDHPGSAIVSAQMTGPGAVVAFETHGTAADADAVCQATQLIVPATSLGGVETSMERRGRYPSERDNGTPETLIRLSVGLEHPDDLWADLTQALEAVAR